MYLINNTFNHGTASALLLNYTSSFLPLALKSWRTNWANISVFFKYPEEIRKTIYTTNIVENVHRQFRKVTKNRSVFPNDDSLKKMLYLAYRDLHKKWTMPVRDWAFALSQFAIIFEERLSKYLN